MNNLMQVKNLISSENKPSFCKEIDLLGVDGNVLIGVTGRVGMGFQFYAPDVLLWEDGRIHSFIRDLEKFLNLLPEGIFLHFIVRAKTGDAAIFSKHSFQLSLRGRGPPSERRAGTPDGGTASGELPLCSLMI